MREVFKDRRITAPVVVAFCCEQWDQRDAWREVAPDAQLVLHDHESQSVADVINRIHGGDIESVPRRYEHWHLSRPNPSDVRRRRGDQSTAPSPARRPIEGQ